MGRECSPPASFPVYSRLLEEGKTKLAGRVAGIVASLLALVVSVVVLLRASCSRRSFVDLVAPGFKGDLRLLTIHIVQIMFPGVGILVLSAWCLGILNSHRMFFVSYVAPVLWNVAMIGTLARLRRVAEPKRPRAYPGLGLRGRARRCNSASSFRSSS